MHDEALSAIAFSEISSYQEGPAERITPRRLRIDWVETILFQQILKLEGVEGKKDLDFGQIFGDHGICDS